MQKPTDDGLLIHAKLGQNLGHSDGMDKIWLAALTELSVVQLPGLFKGPANQFGVIIFIDAGNLF